LGGSWWGLKQVSLKDLKGSRKKKYSLRAQSNHIGKGRVSTTVAACPGDWKNGKKGGAGIRIRPGRKAEGFFKGSQRGSLVKRRAWDKTAKRGNVGLEGGKRAGGQKGPLALEGAWRASIHKHGGE